MFTLPSEPFKVTIGSMSRFLSPWNPITRALSCQGQYLRDSLDSQLQVSYIWLWQKKEGKDGKAGFSYHNRKFPRSSQQAIPDLLAILICKRIISFSSPFRGKGQGELSMDACRHPMAHAKSPFPFLPSCESKSAVLTYWGMSFIHAVIMCWSIYRTISIAHVLHY